MPPKIIIKNLIKIYGKKHLAALKLFREGKTRDYILQSTGNVLGLADISLEINQGEIFVLMGLSGSGKSTLARCINRLIHPTSGHIYIDDEDVAHVGETRMREIRLNKVSMVFQRFGLFPHKTVAENVEYGLKVRGVERINRRQKALETLEVVGLAKWADYKPTSLSGGMQQRVGLARALATDAEILLMDEAFSALDPLTRGEMQDELLRLQKELHKTIVFISHDIQEALKLGDRIAVMKAGAIVQLGTPEELLTQPKDDYITAFIQEVNPAQFITVGSIINQTASLRIGQDSVGSGLKKMLDHNLQVMYVLDQQNKPVGLVKKEHLEISLKQENEDIMGVIETDFPIIDVSAHLGNIFHLYKQGFPLAVVDEEKEFKGMVEASDVLTSLGRQTTQEK
ncbi:MAG: glycine betaine/L-proline ABC transporter ATP-binding protein [Okeania sp. SIO2G4]|uniref:quaternary amine ABC transporter ATP-binding protein n=1 Tax=unclassified Okeania TaxID=2634635 RepID=UPI0013BAE95D|nr:MULTISPECIES: glycine betaine/L-proline ABC transporter ATP-binding protein [unclassified Okeania]NEP41307.1 glycine betaine/L-proline ABC transporter ATP-binding protein [Okeania sp. SIO2H7]NEP75358.1 glycine betaine/L-proline ABC transporter ATP-binding protein [Okeania sp. SIO2G5]NEP95917.1 glycine betaine/L-proline ABC transporter ATP-binding protein [Okeania sp. SIO2F5]NEQ93625.1 glycine betaine/L-proline ABC transporter ATP-binding protein [Okeania sp. SIO2G4]